MALQDFEATPCLGRLALRAWKVGGRAARHRECLEARTADGNGDEKRERPQRVEAIWEVLQAAARVSE